MKTVDFITGATTTVTAFYVLQLKSLQWVATPSIGLSNEMYFGLEAVQIREGCVHLCQVEGASRGAYCNFLATGQSFVAEFWRAGARSAGFNCNTSSQENRSRMLTLKASMGDYAKSA